MEYVEGRDLHQEIRSYRNLPFEKRWERVESIIRQMSRALVVHPSPRLGSSGLKTFNILIGPDGSAKLTDFGIVKDLDPSNDPFVSTTLVGTWAYASPEQVLGTLSIIVRICTVWGDHLCHVDGSSAFRGPRYGGAISNSIAIVRLWRPVRFMTRCRNT